jgi:hypothetical protein
MSCARAEIVAGAIALGEAREDERHAYRAHLAHCSRCVNALGGEREIERTVSLVASARESERWEPDVRRRLARAVNATRLRWLPVAASALVAALVVVLIQRNPTIPHRNALLAPAVSQRSDAIAALGTQNVAALQHEAESLQFRSGATLTLRVVLDEHGKPVRCSVLHGAQRSLDRAFCAAVLRSRL